MLSALFAALTAVFAKIGIKSVNPDLATAIRTVIIMVLAWTIVFSRGAIGSIYSLSKTTWIFLSLSGISTGLSWVFYFRALQVGKVSQVAAVDKLSLALAIVLSIVFLGETLNLKMAIGSILIISGTLILIL